MSLIQSDREKVVAAAARKEPGSDISVLRKSLSYTADTYSILLTKKNIDALLYAAKDCPRAPTRQRGRRSTLPMSLCESDLKS